MRYSNLPSLAYWFCVPKFRYHNRQLRYKNLLTTDFIRLSFRRLNRHCWFFDKIYLYSVIYLEWALTSTDSTVPITHPHSTLGTVVPPPVTHRNMLRSTFIYGGIAIIAAWMMAMCVLSLLLLVVLLVICPHCRWRTCLESCCRHGLQARVVTDSGKSRWEGKVDHGRHQQRAQAGDR